MSSEFIFYDYIDAGGSGSNTINDWLNGDGKQTKAQFNAIIRRLELSTPPGFQDSYWQKPYAWPLHKELKGFWEIRAKVGKIQYRLIGKLEDRKVLLVTWAYYKGTWQTGVTPQTAKDRVTLMSQDPSKYRREHGYI